MKAKDFEDWTRIARRINTKGYLLNKQDVYKINQIKGGMNKGRVVEDSSILNINICDG